jgi:hypothetical protein
MRRVLIILAVVLLWSGGVRADQGSCDGTNNCNSYSIGDNPGVAEPTLEDAPDANSILSPLLDLFPVLRAFQVPGHSGACPSPTLTLFNQSYVMDQHCTMAESVRSELSVASLSAWAVIALVVLMAA